MKQTIEEYLKEELLHSLYFPKEAKTWHDKSWTAVPHDMWGSEKYRRNRRITFKLCWPLVDQTQEFGIFYCALAQMPGKWLASTVHAYKEKNIFRNTYQKEVNPINQSYNNEEHLELTCLEHMTKEYFEENHIGKCKYSIIFFENLTRISIPYGDFVIILDAEKEFIKYYSELFKKCTAGFEEHKKEVIKWCEEKINSGKVPLEKFLWDYFSSKPTIPELSQKFSDCFDNRCYLINDEPHVIQNAGIYLRDGLPIVRYENSANVSKRILITYDEFEFFLETTHNEQKREKMEEFFGNVQYTVSVYEKLVEITHPVDKKYLLTLTINNNNDDIMQRIFFPEPMEKIFEHIHDLDWEDITSGIFT